MWEQSNQPTSILSRLTFILFQVGDEKSVANGLVVVERIRSGRRGFCIVGGQKMNERMECCCLKRSEDSSKWVATRTESSVAFTITPSLGMGASSREGSHIG
jgi:hypothetical protein